MKSNHINFNQELGIDSLKYNQEVVCFIENCISEALDSILVSVTLISGFPDVGGKYYLVKNGKQLECHVVGHALLEGKGTTGIYLARDILNIISVDEIQGMFLTNRNYEHVRNASFISVSDPKGLSLSSVYAS